MSYGGGFYGRTERAHQAPHYDQVPSGTLTTLPGDHSHSHSLRPLRQQPAAHRLLALSADPLPAPPLPHQPPVGPEFDPSSGSEALSEGGGGGGGGEEPDAADPALDIKPVHRFIPDSWKNFFRGNSGRSSSTATTKPPPWPPMPDSSPSPSPPPPSSNNNNNGGGGVRCSPPASPSVPGSSSYRDPYGGGGGSSYNSRKELLQAREPPESLSGRTHHTAMTYTERVEEYHLRYDYMKSWSGLLRILGCVELLLGAAVFACVCAYVHKDNEWFNMFGYSSPGGAYGGGYGGGGGGGGMYGAGGGGGAYYTGPKTPFVLVVAGLAWVVTVIVLVMGMTMYYRTILLDSSWWPLTEFVMNLALAVLYMAAGIMYVRDTTRGGLCSYPVFNNGINGAFCRTEAGQVAAIIFLFVTMVVYLIGAIVCLKLWRHESARKYREKYGHEMQQSAEAHAARITAAPAPIYKGPEPVQGSKVDHVPPPALHLHKAAQAKVLQGAIPSGHIPKPVVMPDYIAKYPTVRSDDERDQYRAVFNDQYAEYKEIHSDVQATLKRFEEMDALMHSLPQHPHNQMEFDRINRILQEFQRKKSDPTFLEKKERCEYLKNKLSHIKQRIHEYDKVMEWNDGYD